MIGWGRWGKGEGGDKIRIEKKSCDLFVNVFVVSGKVSRSSVTQPCSGTPARQVWR